MPTGAWANKAVKTSPPSKFADRAYVSTLHVRAHAPRRRGISIMNTRIFRFMDHGSILLYRKYLEGHTSSLGRVRVAFVGVQHADDTGETGRALETVRRRVGTDHPTSARLETSGRWELVGRHHEG